MTGSGTSGTPRWRKSSFSNEANCVEIAELADDTVAVRNDSHPIAEALVFTRSEIRAFLQGVKAGEFDDLA